jgi:hypothetical protein
MMCFAFLAATGAMAQQKKTVPPPPKPADDGPSLEITMKFIQDKLNDIGPVNYVIYYHDNEVGNDWTAHQKSELTNAVADPSACRISYHVKETGEVPYDSNDQFSLENVKNIAVMSLEQRKKQISTAMGHPSWKPTVDPPVFLVDVRRTDVRWSNAFAFFDEELANRVAKALLRAVELCGGGNKEPF